VNIKSTREASVQAICETAKKDSRIVLISPDALLAARATPFKEQFPDRFIEVGIAEQNSVDVAAGLATTGMHPVVISYAGFLTMRACEMIRTFVAYPGLAVTMIGLNGGMLGGEREGVTHQFYEDVGILRSMPGVAVITPADAGQVYKAVLHALSMNSPVYVRLASGREPEVFPDETPFVFGKIREVKSYGDDAAIFASGYIMDRAIEATEKLREQSVNVTLIDVSTVKPIDTEGITAVLQRTRRAVTVEDHNIYGGLGSAVCEVSCAHAPAKVVRVGLQDRYPSSGTPDDLLDHYGLSVNDIIDGVKESMI